MMKRVVKLLISLIYLVFITFKYRNKNRLVILYYHSVPEKSIGKFKKQITILKKYTTPIGFTEDCLNQKKCSLVTFDDGFQSVIENALPILQKNTIPCILFILGEQFGSKPPWLDATEHEDKNETILTVDQLKQIPTDDVIIGAHGMSHSPLTNVSSEQKQRELEKSKDILTQHLQRDITLFSFPHGYYDQEALNMCQQIGYRNVFTIEPQIITDPTCYKQGRVAVDLCDSAIEFYLKIHGAYSWMTYWSRMRETFWMWKSKIL